MTCNLNVSLLIRPGLQDELRQRSLQTPHAAAEDGAGLREAADEARPLFRHVPLQRDLPPRHDHVPHRRRPQRGLLRPAGQEGQRGVHSDQTHAGVHLG